METDNDNSFKTGDAFGEGSTEKSRDGPKVIRKKPRKQKEDINVEEIKEEGRVHDAGIRGGSESVYEDGIREGDLPVTRHNDGRIQPAGSDQSEMLRDRFESPERSGQDERRTQGSAGESLFRRNVENSGEKEQDGNLTEREVSLRKQARKNKQRERAEELKGEKGIDDFPTSCREADPEVNKPESLSQEKPVTVDAPKQEPVNTEVIKKPARRRLFGNWEADEESSTKETASGIFPIRNDLKQKDEGLKAVHKENEIIKPDNPIPGKKPQGTDIITGSQVLDEDGTEVFTRRSRIRSAGNIVVGTAAAITQKAGSVISKATGEKDDNASSDALKAGEQAGTSVTRFGFNRVAGSSDTFGGTAKETSSYVAENSFGMGKKPLTKEQAKKEANRKRLRRKRLFLRRKAKRAAQAGKKAADSTKKTVSIGKFIGDTVFHGSKVMIGIIAFIVLIIVFSGQTAMSVLPTTIESATMEKAASYQSSPAWLDAADLKLSSMELGLRRQIDNIEEDHPDFEEYSYTLGEIGHDPFTLINYLSAQYGVIGDEALAEIDSLFEAMYELKLTEVDDVRKRWVPKPKEEEEEDEEEDENEDDEEEEGDESGDDDDEDDDDDDEDDEPELVEEEYVVKVLKVELITHSLGEIVNTRLSGSGEKRSMYQLYNSTHGMMQFLGSPVTSSWSVESYYGYRRNPITDEDEAHRGLDISVPDGTQVLSSLPGRVTAKGYDDAFGNYLTITNENGMSVSFAHLSSISVELDQEVTIGEPIGLSGSTGTEEGSCLHMEFQVNGNYFNPLFYTKNGN